MCLINVYLLWSSHLIHRRSKQAISKLSDLPDEFNHIWIWKHTSKKSLAGFSSLPFIWGSIIALCLSIQTQLKLLGFTSQLFFLPVVWPRDKIGRNKRIDDIACHVEKFRHYALEMDIKWRRAWSDFYFRNLAFDLVWRMVWKSTKLL